MFVLWRERKHMHTEIVAYYGGGGGSGWGGGRASLEPRCCFMGGKESLLHTVCACAKIPRNSDSSIKHHISFFCVLNINYLLHYCLFHLYNIFTTLTGDCLHRNSHVHYFCLSKAPEPVQGQNSRDKDVAIGDLVGLGASEVAISRYGIVIF